MSTLKKSIRLIPVFLLAVIIIFLIIMAFIKPDKETLIGVLVENGIDIMGSDSDMTHPFTNDSPDGVGIGLDKEDVKDFQIIESGYDFINQKYFCIFAVHANRQNQYTLSAKALMLLHYDKGWKLSERIGVVQAQLNYRSEQKAS